jgi:hypothetical protein
MRGKGIGRVQNLNDYELVDTDGHSFVFWQRYYSDDHVHQSPYSIKGQPRCVEIYAQKEGGFYSRDATKKRTDPYYSSWREPLIMGLQYEFRSRLADLAIIGVITMKFVKPDQTSTPLK